ncbi:CPBP family intramembrane glutamic endopeptidase [Sulfurovum sp. NBC37-1]|uniref:CPBP family intramembrane glutamic endopeptidase n=1 Tax=Sulfurovum sp. (strain NBC37-1) TaxID=387093 RepID=UPI0001587801|nr:type II CAAX endopeptidase family protein [Sulfurovum sp. NBC37-1]BAF71362.1 conserved hypothetical protein [Sulfurovum sp. NBC37-1]
MLKKFRDNPLSTAFIIIGIYGFWFISPVLFGFYNPDKPVLDGIAGGISQWKNQLIIGFVLVGILTVLGWWKTIGFTKMNPGSIKFLLPIFILAMLMLITAWMLNDNQQNWFAGFSSSSEFFILLLVMLILGFTEEGIFRGILFYGLGSKFTPLYTVLLSAVIFGLFHYINILAGKPFAATSYQVIHAMGMGFLYASLRLHIGAIWPLMILHGIWDFSLFTLVTVLAQNNQGATEHITQFSALGAGAVAFPAISYGIFIYWHWHKTHHIMTQRKKFNCIRSNNEYSFYGNTPIFHRWFI